MSKQVVSLTLKEAESLGIVKCKNCGWPRNNHFDWKPYPCAHDPKCKGYKRKFIMGKEIKP